ncbi:GTP-binding signal recognition particle SRP54, G-domain [Candidatus Sulfopaludibacter sp. SbA3]|nr:GTP-binding signal recognition particle SRP54, G-domain [Candidatus Sulfopaludibacter sp. SbA3]
MRIKSYYARTIEDAMAQASQELGPEALLVNSRKAPPEALHLGAYEVVFAIDAPPAEPGESSQGEALAVSGFGDRLSADVAELKRELEGMRRVLTRTAFGPAQWPGALPTSSDGYAALTAAEVSPELAREIVQGAESRMPAARTPAARTQPRPDGTAFQHALVEELESRFTAQPVLGRGEAKPRIVALVGPPGSGKTSTLVKLAVNYGLASRRPVLLLSVDTYRVAAAEQLRSYAAILGVGFQVPETVTALAQAIEENRGKELIFIDTPGLSAGELDDSSGLARFLATRPDIDTQLVLSASMKSADLTRVVDSFQVFGPQRLVFTKLDETSSFGPIFNEAARTGKPLSFFANGQRIPEDLEAVSARRLTELILNNAPGRSRSAA